MDISLLALIFPLAIIQLPTKKETKTKNHKQQQQPQSANTFYNTPAFKLKEEEAVAHDEGLFFFVDELRLCCRCNGKQCH
jgi:hypothetical protein